MHDYTWVITRDTNTHSHEDRVGHRGLGLEGLDNSQVIEHPESIEFRMRGDDGQVYYHGFFLGDPRDEDAMAEPLDRFGRKHQCHQISYRIEATDRWEIIKFI